MKNEELFSQQAGLYAKFRPAYPAELYQYILSFVKERNLAWDCATGNGQAAAVLANYFDQVYATDISAAQLANAKKSPNIRYQISNEVTPFGKNLFDLITVAQAYHWLDWSLFREEARRVGKKESVVAIWNYTCFYTEDESVNRIIDHFHNGICGRYWDDRRRFVDEKLETVEFDFDPLPSRAFSIDADWLPEQVLGYFGSWSAVQQYIRINHKDPINLIRDELTETWGVRRIRRIHFPVYLRIGRVGK